MYVLAKYQNAIEMIVAHQIYRCFLLSVYLFLAALTIDDFVKIINH